MRSDGRALAKADRDEALTEDRIARAFHETYEALAPTFGYHTRDASAKPWPDVPENNKRLMRATVRHLLNRGVIRADRVAPDRGESPFEHPAVMDGYPLSPEERRATERVVERAALDEERN